MSNMQEFSYLCDEPITPDLLLSFMDETQNEPNAYKKRFQAERCLVHMRNRNINRAYFIGPFVTRIYNPGDKITLKPGMIRHSFNPKIPTEGSLLKRSQKITISEAFAGSAMDTISMPTIRWVGAGGYYCWVNLFDIEI